jgi:hypothetical protein
MPIPTPRLHRLSALLSALLALGALAACDKKPGTDAVPVPAPSTSSPSPTAGVVPTDPNQPAASDRPGAVAIGAVEAGQAGKGGSGSATQPTAGDGAPGAGTSGTAASGAGGAASAASR